MAETERFRPRPSRGQRPPTLLKLVAGKEILLADETTQRVQEKGKTRTAWLWSFIARDDVERELIAYVFSRSRSGDTPVEVLGVTKGKLVADA